MNSCGLLTCTPETMSSKSTDVKFLTQRSLAVGKKNSRQLRETLGREDAFYLSKKVHQSGKLITKPRVWPQIYIESLSLGVVGPFLDPLLQSSQFIYLYKEGGNQ